MTATQEDGILESQVEKLAEAFEIAWSDVFKIINHFITQHDQFGFKLIKEKSNPSIEDMLLSLKVMGAILNALEGSLSDPSEHRMCLNAQQQIILFERAILAVQSSNESEYSEVVDAMRKQAQF